MRIFALLLIAICFTKGNSQERTQFESADRYKLVMTTEYRQDMYKVDTKLGQLWIMTFDSVDNTGKFIPVPYDCENYGGCAYPYKVKNAEGLKAYMEESYNGRFEFNCISDFRRDQYMIDHITGKVWGLILYKEMGYMLKEIPNN